MDIKPTYLLPNVIAVSALKRTEVTDSIEEIATKGWIFAHSIASLVAADMMVYDSEKNRKNSIVFYGIENAKMESFKTKYLLSSHVII